MYTYTIIDAIKYLCIYSVSTISVCSTSVGVSNKKKNICIYIHIHVYICVCMYIYWVSVILTVETVNESQVITSLLASMHCKLLCQQGWESKATEQQGMKRQQAIEHAIKDLERFE